MLHESHRAARPNLYSLWIIVNCTSRGEHSIRASWLCRGDWFEKIILVQFASEFESTSLSRHDLSRFENCKPHPRPRPQSKTQYCSKARINNTEPSHFASQSSMPALAADQNPLQLLISNPIQSPHPFWQRNGRTSPQHRTRTTIASNQWLMALVRQRALRNLALGPRVLNLFSFPESPSSPPPSYPEFPPLWIHIPLPLSRIHPISVFISFSAPLFKFKWLIECDNFLMVVTNHVNSLCYVFDPCVIIWW